MATAKKTSSGSWTISVYEYKDSEGKQHYKRFTAKTKKEAELLAAQFSAGRIHSTDLLTVKEALAEYIALRTATLSPSSIYGYRKLEKRLLADYPAFMSKSINSIKQNDVQGLISNLSLNHSPKTVRNYYGLIQAISDRFKTFKISLPQTIEYEPYIPSEAEIQTLLSYVKGKEIEIPIMLGCMCMMRRGEICGLSIDDINFNNKTIHIRHSKVRDEDRNWILKAPKTRKSNRIISVSQTVLDKIKEKGYITSYDPDTLTDRFDDILKDAGISHFRFHDLRHYCASVFHYKGIPMSYTQKYGGWSTMNTLQRIYQHTLADKEDEIYGKMNNYFDSILKES